MSIWYLPWLFCVLMWVVTIIRALPVMRLSQQLGKSSKILFDDMMRIADLVVANGAFDREMYHDYNYKHVQWQHEHDQWGAALEECGQWISQLKKWTVGLVASLFLIVIGMI